MALRDTRGDVARLFETLVRALADAGGDLRRPLQVSAIYQQVVPYRRYRQDLGFDTNEDYEMALLRLLAGEQGYASLHPPEAQDTLAAEAGAVNPDPGLVREFAGAVVRLDPGKAARVLGDEARYAPAAAGKAAEPVEEILRGAAFAAEPEPPQAHPPVAQEICRNCGRSLPLHREVVYCPFCGGQAGERTCAGCGEQLEEGWRFCVRCGAPSPAGPARPDRPSR